jgi:DNA/RNA-binding domain of Phe-tRNA-synthetase-like protein
MVTPAGYNPPVVALDFSVAETLCGRVRVGVLVIEGVSVRDAEPALAAEVDGLCASLRERYGDGKSSEVPGAADARTLYKALGIDPTKMRPSNEALLRRALKGEPLYRINPLVDSLNLCSLREQLPFGLYDLDRVRPPVTLRRGGLGEAYEGIRKGAVNVEGRPVLVDAEGPFGNPTSDSARTMVTSETRRALVVAYAPAGCSAARLDAVIDATAATLTRYCGGRVAERRLLPPRA